MNADAKTGAKNDEALNPLNEDLVRLLVENHRKFQKYLKKHINDDAVVEDLLQTSIRKAIESKSSLEKESLVPILYKILKNTIIDHYRSRAAEEKKYQEFAASVESQSDELEAVICQCLKELLPTLRQEYADVIDSIDLSQKSIKETAKKLKVSENNLSVRLHRARAALKKSLERACGSCTKHGCLDCSCQKAKK